VSITFVHECLCLFTTCPGGMSSPTSAVVWSCRKADGNQNLQYWERRHKERESTLTWNQPGRGEVEKHRHQTWCKCLVEFISDIIQHRSPCCSKRDDVPTFGRLLLKAQRCSTNLEQKLLNSRDYPMNLRFTVAVCTGRLASTTEEEALHARTLVS